jgi:hypothetical protein
MLFGPMLLKGFLVNSNFVFEGKIKFITVT